MFLKHLRNTLFAGIIVIQIPNLLKESIQMADRFLKWLENILPTLIAAIVILIAGLILSKIAIKLMSKGLKRSKIDPTAHSFMLSLVKTVLYVFIFIIVLSTLNVPMSSIIAAVGAAGLAIGLALQNSLSNLAGGFIILFSKPFKKGDYVELCGQSGIVEEISILYTKLLTVDNKAVHIPNGQITNTTITNYTEENLRRLDLYFNVAYDTNFRKAISIIEKLAKEHPMALDAPEAPLVRLFSHESSSLKIVARIWVASENYWTLNFDMMENVKDEFDKNGIEIPFDQLDVHIDNN